MSYPTVLDSNLKNDRLTSYMILTHVWMIRHCDATGRSLCKCCIVGIRNDSPFVIYYLRHDHNVKLREHVGLQNLRASWMPPMGLKGIEEK
jgi:hypothetical protein